MPRTSARAFLATRMLLLAVAGGGLVAGLAFAAAPAEAAPSITITKQVVGEGPATTKPQARTYTAGTRLTWQYVLTNTGTEPVYNPHVTDSQGNPVTGCPASLAPGQSGTCTSADTVGGGLYGTPATAPTLMAATLPLGVTDKPYEWPLPRTGSPAPTISLTSGSLPSGMRMDTSGVISGTPTTVGNSTFTVAARNSAATATQTYTISVRDAAPAISSMSLSTATAGRTYSEQVIATGKNITWGVIDGALPAGLNLNPATGVISGTPTAEGSARFALSASNSGGTVSRSINLTVQAGPPTLADTNLPDARYGVAYSQQVPGVGKGLTYKVVSGRLPSGLTMNSAGLITGASNAVWTQKSGDRQTFSVEASNTAGSAVARIDLKGYPAPPPPAPWTGTLSRTVMAPSISAIGSYCIPDMQLELLAVEFTQAKDARLTNSTACTSSKSNLQIRSVSGAGTYRFELKNKNITGETAPFTLSVVVKAS